MSDHWLANSVLLPLLLAVTLTVAGCERAQEASRGSTAADTARAVDPAAPGSTARTSASAESAGTRGALPNLFSIMLGLQRDMDRISHGLWIENHDSIAAAAQVVADHPAIPPEEGAAIGAVLGEDMARFQAMDRNVHDLAVRLAEEAEMGNMEAVLETHSALYAGCLECHTAFRDRLREGVRDP